jgi:hypothetical protein
MATQPVVTGPEIDQETGKFVYNYQPRDSEGQFIGKPYRFLYTDHEDLVKQLTEAKEHGDRFIYEVKSGKRKLAGEPAVQQPTFQPAPESTEEAEKKRREEFRKTAEQEFGAPIETVRERLKRQQMTEEYTAAQHWAMNKAAEGYYACPANSKAITDWLKEKKYAFTPSNYDLAFEELKDTLVQEPQEPVVTADSTQQPPTQAKPQSTGIIPGQFAGTRQPGRPEKQPLTRERFRQIERMSRDQWNRLRRESPKDAEAYLLMKTPAQPQQ